jgi:transposase InsO family protein
VRHVQQVFGISERRACKAVGQARATQRFRGRRAELDRELLERMRALAHENPACGYRMIWAMLKREGMEVNIKRVHRLWKQAGLKVTRPRPARPCGGTSENACHVKRAEAPNHVWTYDFTFDETRDGRKLKFLVVIDEYTRQCLRIEVSRSMGSRTVIRILAELVQVHGEPGALRSDNGPEFIANAVQAWLAAAGVSTLYIQPGSPWENAYVESFNSRFRREFLSRELFNTLAEAQVLTEKHRLWYNHVRPHSSLEYQTPAQFAISCAQTSVACAAAQLRPSYTPQGMDTAKTVEPVASSAT